MVRKRLALNGHPVSWTPLWNDWLLSRAVSWMRVTTDLILTFPMRVMFCKHSKKLWSCTWQNCWMCVCVKFREKQRKACLWVMLPASCHFSSQPFVMTGVHHANARVPSRAETWEHAEFVWSAVACLLFWTLAITASVRRWGKGEAGLG